MARTAKSEWQNSPTAWFAVLERARLTGDSSLERRAVAQLARLGVTVHFEHGDGKESTREGARR